MGVMLPFSGPLLVLARSFGMMQGKTDAIALRQPALVVTAESVVVPHSAATGRSPWVAPWTPLDATRRKQMKRSRAGVDGSSKAHPLI